jgi:creatinine amidohydrolase
MFGVSLAAWEVWVTCLAQKPASPMGLFKSSIKWSFTMRFERMSAPMINALDKAKTVVVIPTGATEQHGPHLPTGTDSLIGQGIVDALDKAMGGKLLVTPMLSVTCSEHHMPFGGTLTISHETYKTGVMETIGSLYKIGFRRFVIHNSHGGNRAVGGVIAEKCAFAFPEASVVFATWFSVASAALKPLVEGAYPAVGHACEFETSVMLHLHPELVDMSKAVDGGDADAQPPFRSDLLTGSAASRGMRFDQMSTNGVWGKATLASAAKGKKIMDITVAELVKMIGVMWPE